MNRLNRFQRSAPGSHRACSMLHPPQLEGSFSHMTSNAAHKMGRRGTPINMNDGDTDNSA